MTQLDEKLLQELGRTWRERETNADRRALEALARGELPDEELASLRERARRDAHLETALDLFQPLAAADHARITASLLRGRAVPARAPLARLSSRVAKLARGSRLQQVTALAAACVCLCVLALTQQRSSFPRFSIRVSQTDEAYRAASARPMDTNDVVLGPHRRITIHLRPDMPTAAPLSANVQLAYRVSPSEQRLLDWPASARSSDQGAIELRMGEVPDAALDARGAELRVVVSEARRHAITALFGDTRSQRWSLPVRIERPQQ